MVAWVNLDLDYNTIEMCMDNKSLCSITLMTMIS